MLTIPILHRIIILHITIAVLALMPMMRRIVLPLLPPVVTACINRLDFGRVALAAGKCFLARYHAGGRNRNYTVVPIVRLHIRRCIAAGALIPVLVSIRFLFGEIVTQSLDRAAADRADHRVRAGGRLGAAGVVANRPQCRDRHILGGHLCREFLVPACEDIARSCQDRLGDRRVAIRVDPYILLAVFGLDRDPVRKGPPPGIQRHIPGDRVVKVPPLRGRAVGILIPALEAVTLPHGIFLGFSDTLVQFLFAGCRTGQCAAVRIERDRAHGGLFPVRIQCAVVCLVICGRAMALFVAVLPAAPLLIKPAAEKISLVPRYRHLIKFLTIGDLHGFLRHRAAVGVKSHHVDIRRPFCRALYGIVGQRRDFPFDEGIARFFNV